MKVSQETFCLKISAEYSFDDGPVTLSYISSIVNTNIDIKSPRPRKQLCLSRRLSSLKCYSPKALIDFNTILYGSIFR